MKNCKECGKDLSGLSSNCRYCSAACRQKYNNRKQIKKRKKLRLCIQCGKEYDYIGRNRKKTCSEECAIISKNHTVPTNKCKRCGIEKNTADDFCGRCMEINRALMNFKKEMGCPPN